MTEVNIGLLRLSVEQVLRCRCAFNSRRSHIRSNVKFRKRPVIIEARQLVGTTADFHAVYQWIEANTLGSFEPMAVIEGREPYPASGVSIDPRDGRLIISTLEGLHWADPGDWIIRGIKGEFYPIKPNVFADSYEEVSR